MYDVILSIL